MRAVAITLSAVLLAACQPTERPPLVLQQVNDRINRDITYTPDQDEKRDHCKPMMRAVFEGGDCDDYVCAKAELLAMQGITDTRMVGGYTSDGQAHVVLEVAGWYLDNRHDAVTAKPIDFRPIR
jgi:predicted transglutaminase-like cysteine proteinase